MSRSQYLPMQIFTGNGSVATYDFDFLIQVKNQLLVEIYQPSDNYQTPVSSFDGDDDSDYLNLTFDQFNGGGSLQLNANLTNLYKIVFYLGPAEPVQDYKFRLNGDFTPKRVEDAFDYCNGILQRHQWYLDRTVWLHPADDASAFNSRWPKGLPTASWLMPVTKEGGGGWAPLAEWVAKPDLEAAVLAAENAAASAAESAASASASAGSAEDASSTAVDVSAQVATATAAASSATSSATAAANSATAAAASATAASGSASSAATSASTATTQAGNASTSATNAATSATAAGTSATASATSATASAASATSAATSAAQAAASAGNVGVTGTSSIASATGPADLTGLLLDSTTYKMSYIFYSIQFYTDDPSHEEHVEAGMLICSFLTKSNKWIMTQGPATVDSGISLTITDAGQIQYTAPTIGGVANTHKVDWRLHKL